jgi:hypothetical protein
MNRATNSFSYRREDRPQSITVATIAAVGAQVREQVQARQAFVRETFSWEGPDPVESLSPWNS